ncbi:ABC transporter permease [Massilia sp. TS11]|uniref:ABC transporter permease n=1 Tax=Massilia sp. TS11 TaxID=2908003 RepID=UPI001EDA19AD|nr:FtsX-like permease family protein [Massilia sp. TS11]MCG2584839.1 ABC transporter permease [Massilia sp. TS11]
MDIKPIFSALLRNKTGAILVALQVAISLAILSNAVHIISLRQAMAARPSGIANEGQVFSIFQRTLREQGHEEQLANQQRAAEALRGVPGVRSVASVSQIPMSFSGSNTGVAVERTQTRETATVAYYYTAESLIDTWGLKLVGGRDFQPSEVQIVDRSKSVDWPEVAIITRALAEKLWPGQDAVGRTFFNGTGDEARPMRVVGVIERLQSYAAETSERGEFSMILPQRATGAGNFSLYTVRADQGDLAAVMKNAEEALRKASHDPSIVRARAISQERKDRYRSDMAMAWMLVTVSALLLLITASGIVGMASLWVTQRRKQIGVRRALGARKIDILRYFITENFLITSLGVAAGVVGAIGLNSLLVAQLEMTPLPLTYLLFGALLFWGLGVLAVYGPAWRAASISPALATRST